MKNRYFETGLVSSKISDDGTSKNLPGAGRGLSPLSHFLAAWETSVGREVNSKMVIYSSKPRSLFLEVTLRQRFLSYTGVPGISPTPWSRPPGAKSLGISPRGKIHRDLTLPARPPLGISPPPPPSQGHISENILVFRPSYQESFWSMVWQFIWQWICTSQTQSQCCLIFSKVGVDFLVIVYVNIVLQLRAWFCCFFLILPNLSIVSWMILVSD